MIGKLSKRLMTLGLLSVGLFALPGLASEKGGVQIALQGTSQDIIAYGQMCAKAIGAIPEAVWPRGMRAWTPCAGRGP